MIAPAQDANCSRPTGEDSRDLLRAVQPGGHVWTAPFYDPANALVIFMQISSEDGLVMRDPVSQLPDLVDVIEQSGAGF